MLFDDKPRLDRCFTKQRDPVSSVGDGYKYLTHCSVESEWEPCVLTGNNRRSLLSPFYMPGSVPGALPAPSRYF